MKKLIITALMGFSLNAVANDWVVLTPAQQRLVTKDSCAQAAVDAAAGLVSDEIQDAGVDYPDHLYLMDLHVSQPRKVYAITFQGDTTILVRTRVQGSKCRAYKPSRFNPEPRLSGGN